MKRIISCAVILSIAFFGTLNAQESASSEAVPETPTDVAATDNPGMGILDQATEAKLRATTAIDLGHVIVLCRRAKRVGLTGENLKYCNELLASSQLQRGIFLAQALEQPDAPADNWQELRQQALTDLEEAVAVIKDQPMAYMRIAGLHLMPGGNRERAKEALELMVQSAKNSLALQFEAVSMLAELEPDAEKRETIWATAAKSGHPRTLLFHAFTLFELKRNEEAGNVLQKLLEAEGGNVELHDQIVTLLIRFREYKTALSILDSLRTKSMDIEQQYRIDLRKAELFAKWRQYDEALKLLDSLSENSTENPELLMQTLELRCLIYLAKDAPEDALKAIETAEKAHPDLAAPILEQKYGILFELERYDDALAVVKKLQPKNESPQNFLREILILNELKKYDDAIEIVRKLKEKYPENESGWTMLLVEIYSHQKAYDKALALVEEQLKENPNEMRWIVAKTQVFLAQKNWDQAVDWLDLHIQKNFEPERLSRLLISVLYSQKKYKTAKERIKPLLEKSPNDLDLLRDDSQLSISLGLHAEAIEALTKIVAADSEDYTSINNLAWILCTSPEDSIRNGRRAVELAEQAGKLTDYKRAFVLSTLAAAYAEAGDFEKAREMSLKSVEVAKTEKNKTEEERQELLEHLQKEWNCFERNQPFRELLDDEDK